MQHRSVLIGVLTAELAVGVLAAASPAAADPRGPSPEEPGAPQRPVPVRDGHTDIPLPDPLPDVSLSVDLPIRTGRAGDVAAEPPDPAPAPPEPSAPADVPAPPAPARRSAPAQPSAPLATPAPKTPAAPTGAARPAAAAPPPAHTVAPGDSLWEIAARHLASATGRDRAALAAPEIASYWVSVCEANRSRLGSGDPNLIYAGEVVELPPI